MGDSASSALVELAAGDLRLSLSPGTGGAIARFDFIDGARRFPILRGCEGTPGHALEAASFPLVPFVNRIRGGQFDFRGEQVRLAPNMAGDPSPLHGQGWLHPWTMTSSNGREAVLEYTHEAGEWPWSYIVRQHFKLNDRALEIDLTCRNLSPRPMPCGLGQHPYFHCSSTTRLRTDVDHVWTIDEQVLPVERVAAEGPFDLSDGPVCGLGLDHGFGGWSGEAQFSDADWPIAISLTSAGTRFFQLYSPRDGGIFVAEPVTHANAALNAPESRWADLGMQILAPDEEMTLVMRLEINRRS